MMEDYKLATYKIWAPDNALWTEWAKPVLFANLPYGGTKKLDVPEINWLKDMNNNMAVIVDLPGKSGVEEGLALAGLGFRPVPLYNGVCETGPEYASNVKSMIVDVSEIVAALYKGATILSELKIKPDAQPVFLLDHNRMKGNGKDPGKYDNRWCVFPQDMPSASFMLKKGVKQIIVYSAYIQNDLSHILYRYQQEGIMIYQYNGYEPVKFVTVLKPSQFKSLFYRFKVISGLTRNATGGFGGLIPEPEQSSSGYGYRRYGMG